MSPRAADDGRTASILVESIAVTVQVVTAPVLAGGPLEVEYVVENRGDVAGSVPMGADRSRQRPSQVLFTGVVAESGLELSDPWAGLPNRGGVGGPVELAPGASLRQVILINDFLSLNDLRSSTPPGETVTLQLHSSRRLDGHQSQTAELDLRIPIRRDDDALTSLAASLRQQLQTDPPADIASREQLIAQLAAIATHDATRDLEGLSEHSDTHLAGLARAALRRRDLLTSL